MDEEKELKEIKEIDVNDIEIKVDGKTLNLNNFIDWYIWIEEKDKDSIFDKEIHKGSE